jgi:hypothetical protein
MGALGEQHRALGQLTEGLGGRVHESIAARDLRHVMRSIRAMQAVSMP